MTLFWGRRSIVMNKVKSFLKSRRGINTVEVVIILAIMVGLAILFRKQIGGFAKELMNSIFEHPDTQNLVDF